MDCKETQDRDGSEGVVGVTPLAGHTREDINIGKGDKCIKCNTCTVSQQKITTSLDGYTKMPQPACVLCAVDALTQLCRAHTGAGRRL